MCGFINPLGDRNKTQDDLDQLGKWASGNQLKINGEKTMSVVGALVLKPVDPGLTSLNLYPLTDGNSSGMKSQSAAKTLVEAPLAGRPSDTARTLLSL